MVGALRREVKHTSWNLHNFYRRSGFRTFFLYNEKDQRGLMAQIMSGF